jgi:CheY-like chemotaxis protein
MNVERPRPLWQIIYEDRSSLEEEARKRASPDGHLYESTARTRDDLGQKEKLHLQQEKTSETTALPGKRVLVVEDHAECANLIKIILESKDWQVECVASGSEALRFLTERLPREDGSFDPDVVIIDLRLPDMSGVEVIGQLQRRGARIPPTVIVTADSPRVLNEATSGFSAVGIRKPFDFEELFSAIADAMTRSKV